MFNIRRACTAKVLTAAYAKSSDFFEKLQKDSWSFKVGKASAAIQAGQVSLNFKVERDAFEMRQTKYCSVSNTR